MEAIERVWIDNREDSKKMFSELSCLGNKICQSCLQSFPGKSSGDFICDGCEPKEGVGG